MSKKIVETNSLSALKHLFSIRKCDAIRFRKLEFSISQDSFIRMSRLNCHYCNSKPSQVIRKSGVSKHKSCLYNGLDRIKPNIGYTEENCVPCCKTCNWFKWTLSEQEFLDHIEKIVMNFGKPQSFHPCLENPYKLYSQYKNSAKSRGYEFNIPRDSFWLLTSMSCYYCGTKPNQKIKNYRKYKGLLQYPNYEYVYNSLDRIDNSIGYHLHNVVSCCNICNVMKNKMSQEEFISHVRKIHENKSLSH